MNNDKKLRAEWQVAGITHSEKGMTPKKLIVRYTSDAIGKSLSIADEELGIMLQIPFDGIYKQI